MVPRLWIVIATIWWKSIVELYRRGCLQCHVIRDSSKLMRIGLVHHASIEPGLGVGRHVYLYNMSNIPRVVFSHEESFNIHYPRPKGSMNVNTSPSRDPLYVYFTSPLLDPQIFVVMVVPHWIIAHHHSVYACAWASLYYAYHAQ